VGNVVGQKKYEGLELDERTGGRRDYQLAGGNDSVAGEAQRMRLGEKAAERKESFLR
jgi:hypothetical protein